MAENPDLELEEAADPKRLVSILYLVFLFFGFFGIYKVLAGEIGKTKMEAANIMLMVSFIFCI